MLINGEKEPDINKLKDFSRQEQLRRNTPKSPSCSSVKNLVLGQRNLACAANQLSDLGEVI